MVTLGVLTVEVKAGVTEHFWKHFVFHHTTRFWKQPSIWAERDLLFLAGGHFSQFTRVLTLHPRSIDSVAAKS